MSDSDNNIHRDSATPGMAGPSDADAKLARRRRFIKLGASAVPVAMTLASRPVMAWECHTTSAWGSAQLTNMTGSAKTRLDDTAVHSAECWYVTDWMSSSSTAPCWRALTTKCYGSSKSCDYGRSNCKISDIFPLGLSGVSNPTTKTAYSIITGTDAFAKAITVARLNSIYGAGASNITLCVFTNGKDQIQEMARLGALYAPPNNTGVTWSKTDITTYLYNSWIAR
nr:hypothetical protein [uncultured Roseateles sp.]